MTGIDEQVADLRRGQRGLRREHVAALAVVADEVADLLRAVAVDDRRREARVVHHRLEVVAHAAVDGDVRAHAALDGDDRVERQPGAADDRAPGLDDQVRAPASRCSCSARTVAAA